jgi:hypothetical protein
MENAQVTESIATVSVSDESVIITPRVVSYVNEYRNFARKTAESIIGLATTLVDAEQNLNGVDFSIFCDEVGIKKGDATYSKLRKIGMNASRFQPHLDNLPNSWTTLYELAKLETSKFDSIASDLNPFTTAKDVSEAAGSKKQQGKKDVIDLTICFGKLGSSTKKEVYDTILEMKKKFNFSLKEGQLFINEMKTVKTRKVA